MNKKLVSVLSLATFLVLPVVASAITLPGIVSIVIADVTDIFVAVFFAAVIIYFAWYAIMFLKAKGDPTGVAEARMGVVWGVVGVVVGVVGFNIINFVTTWLKLDKL